MMIIVWAVLIALCLAFVFSMPELVPCDRCGELVAKPYLRVVGEKHMCTPCSGYNI